MTNFHRIALCLALFFALCPPLSAQNGQIKFERIALDHGLSQNSVYSINQDSRGFLWFATQDGLNRYDGYVFKPFRHSPNDSTSLSSNTVQVVYEDARGNFWVGNGKGLDLYHHKTSTFQKTNQCSEAAPSKINVTSIAQSHPDTLWVGTWKGIFFVALLSPEPLCFQQASFNNRLSDPHIRSLAFDSKGMLWAGTPNGLNRIDKATGAVKRYFNEAANPKSLPNNNVFALLENHQGVMFVGTGGGGLCYFEPKDDSFKRVYYADDTQNTVSADIVTVIYEDSRKKLWIGTDAAGLNLYVPETNSLIGFYNDPLQESTLSHNNVTALFTDRAGVFWVGTDGGGINKYDPFKNKFETVRNAPGIDNGLSDNLILALFISRDGTLWAGASLGLNYWDEKAKKFNALKNGRGGTGHSAIYCLHQDSEGLIWIGSGGKNALSYLNPDTKERVFVDLPLDMTFDKQILALGEAPDGRILVGSDENGLLVYDKKTKEFKVFGLAGEPNNTEPNYVIQQILTDRQKRVWIAAEGGFYRFYSEKDKLIRVPSIKGAEDEFFRDISCLYEDENGGIWLGVFGIGIMKYEEGKKGRLYGSAEGLADNGVYSISGDSKNNLWVSTNKGISKFDTQNEEFKNYSVEDGLQGNEFNQGSAFRGKDGKLYFGGVNGFNVFHPDSLVQNSYAPQIVFTKFEVIKSTDGETPEANYFKGDINEAESITLGHLDNMFSFEFASLHFSAPEKQEYSYRMEGFDAGWIYSGRRRFATYTNLPPGQYVFKVKSSNSDGVWSGITKEIKIIITPPFWKTKWFYALCAAGFALGLFLYVRLRTRSLQQAKQKLEQQVAHRTEMLLAEKEKVEASRAQMFAKQQELEDALGKINLQNEHLQTLNHTKDKFFSIIAHDVKGPLNSLKSFCNLVITYSEHLTRQEIVDTTIKLEESVKNLSGLLENLLHWARSQTGVIEFTSERFDLAEAAKRNTALLKPMAEGKNLTFVLGVPPDGCPVWADVNSTDTVLRNLLSNAIKFSHPGGTIQIRFFSEEGRMVASILDQGVGMSAEVCDKIFRLDVKHSTKGTNNELGTGLGLILCKDFIEKNGGEIWVTSEEGKGSDFRFSLPLPK